MSRSQKSGLLIAAPSSGSGKTVATLALLRAFKNLDVNIAGAKAGPDYIDPVYHAKACGVPSVNLDPWAMNAERITALALGQPGQMLLVEAMMGLFDRAADGTGSAGDLAKMLGLPVILIVDAAKQSHSIAAVVRGFRDHDPNVNLAGVLLNRVGSPRHEQMLRQALAEIDVAVFGAIPRDIRLALPERHLGLVQAGEHLAIDGFIAEAATVISDVCDLEAIKRVFTPVASTNALTKHLTPLGQHIAVAQDQAFTFSYSHMLADWRAQGSELSFFSPLANEAPVEHADAVFLPGGYPELHAATLAGATAFKTGLANMADSGRLIYGECGGYMVLGDSLVDADGRHHAMAGLLSLETSFAKRKLHLGYRRIHADQFALGTTLQGHEFHYTTAVREEGVPLFEVSDALGTPLGKCGLRAGNVMGSYMHIIDGAAA